MINDYVSVPRVERGCGYRKPGGLYLATDKIDLQPCCKLPHELTICPTCSQGIKPSRGWTWVDAQEIFSGRCHLNPDAEIFCPLSHENLPKHEKAGLLWIGSQF